MKITSKTPTETAALAQTVAATLRGGETLALIGELGSGKTTFVKALATTLGVRKPVRSPTFVLMVPYSCHPTVVGGLRLRSANNKYSLSGAKRSQGATTKQSIRTLVHVDAYRVKHARDLEAIGIRDYLGQPDTVTVIEWADRVRALLPKNTLTLRFAHGKSSTERRITLSRGGNSAKFKKSHIPGPLTALKRPSTLK
jgi:tRNA threonylcarbamoyladenosine biosynthesis protein TsaE